MGLVASRVQTRAFGMQRVVDVRGVTVLWHPRAVFACLVLGAVIVGCALLLLTQGSMKLSVTEVGQALAHPGADSRDRLVVWGIRLPMIVTGLATGMALGAAGMLFQTLSRNALGSPEIIGLVSGAAYVSADHRVAHFVGGGGGVCAGGRVGVRVGASRVGVY